MKLLRFGLRSWITLTSMLTFLLGWIMLAHSPKPIQPGSAAAAIPTLAPLPPLDDGGNASSRLRESPLANQPQNNYAHAPVFRTGGS